MEKTFDNETRYRLLKFLQRHPDWSQRQIARGMGISLGKVNYCLRAMIERGFVKVGCFTRHQNKSDYRYLVTPKGMKEKVRATVRFLEAKEREFEALRHEISIVKQELEDRRVLESQ